MFLSDSPLKAGAGPGTNTVRLQSSAVRSWRCIETDPELNAKVADSTAEIPLYTAATGTIGSIAEARFDSILYIDVREHIEADKAELAMATTLLRPGGHIFVLSPAHQLLLSDFDGEIGHYRRYDKNGSMIARLPPNVTIAQAWPNEFGRMKILSEGT